MRHVMSCGALALLVLLTLLLGAARPFERVPAGDETYSQLALLDNAGLLQGYDLPAGELSRLELAVLVQAALANYGEAQLSGRASEVEVEQSLSTLLASYADELGQLGVKSGGLPVATGESRLVQRVSNLESQFAADEEEEAEEDGISNTYLDSLYPEEEEDTEEVIPGVESALFGMFYLQARSARTKLQPGGSDELGDVKLYWGELGWNVSHEDWSGRFSVSWNDAEQTLKLHEAWAKYLHPESHWFAQLGQVLLPFGNNDYYFPTYPAVNDLGYTHAHALGTGVDNPDWGISAYAYNPRVDLLDEDDQVSDYSFVWRVSERAADECQDGWKLRAGYNTHLGSSDLRLAGDGPHYDRAAAYNVFGRYDWGGNRYHFIADYTAAIDEFDVRDLDADGDHVGDKPSALNTEFVYEPCPDNLYGVSYQATSEMADYAETRWGVLYGKRLDDLAMLKLEYTHGNYGAFATADQNTDDTFTAEVFLDF